MRSEFKFGINSLSFHLHDSRKGPPVSYVHSLGSDAHIKTQSWNYALSPPKPSVSSAGEQICQDNNTRGLWRQNHPMVDDDVGSPPEMTSMTLEDLRFFEQAYGEWMIDQAAAAIKRMHCS